MEEKPKVLVSKCLGFCECRYDGQVLPDKFVKALEPFVDFIQVCPEVEIGLGIPRASVKLIMIDGNFELYQPEHDRILTKEMDDYSHGVLSNIKEIHGAILKGRSPTCGIKDVRIYQSLKKGASSIKGVGRFASHVYDYFPGAAIEEEGRLTNLGIREHFLTKLYTNLRFSQIENKGMKDLVEFHTRHKYLLMIYSQKELKNLGKLVANHEKLKHDDVIKLYKDHLSLALENPPRVNNSINTLMHLMGYFSDELISEEKAFILDSLNKLKEKKLHLSVPVNLIRSYAIKYKQDYILNQHIWQPFPDALLDIKDTGK